MFTGLINAVRRKIHNLNDEKENDSTLFECEKHKCKFTVCYFKNVNFLKIIAN